MPAKDADWPDFLWERDEGTGVCMAPNIGRGQPASREASQGHSPHCLLTNVPRLHPLVGGERLHSKDDDRVEGGDTVRLRRFSGPAAARKPGT
jgi:hypothetical protein